VHSFSYVAHLATDRMCIASCELSLKLVLSMKAIFLLGAPVGCVCVNTRVHVQHVHSFKVLHRVSIRAGQVSPTFQVIPRADITYLMCG
jgi:hypothetical protein